MKCPLFNEGEDTQKVLRENIELRRLVDEILVERNFYKKFWEDHRATLDCDDWG